MVIEQYQYGSEKTNSYLIISENRAILVDAPSEKLYMRLKNTMLIWTMSYLHMNMRTTYGG